MDYAKLKKRIEKQYPNSGYFWELEPEEIISELWLRRRKVFDYPHVTNEALKWGVYDALRRQDKSRDVRIKRKCRKQSLDVAGLSEYPNLNKRFSYLQDETPFEVLDWIDKHLHGIMKQIIQWRIAGYAQWEIGKMVGISQSAVCYKLKHFRKEINDRLVKSN